MSKIGGLPQDDKLPKKEQTNIIIFGSSYYPLYKNPITSSEFQRELHFLRRKDNAIKKGSSVLTDRFLKAIKAGWIEVKKEKLSGVDADLKKVRKMENKLPQSIKFIDNSTTNDTSLCGEVLNPFTLRMIDTQSRTAKKFLNGKIEVPKNRRDIMRLVRKTATKMVNEGKINANIVIDITTLSNFMKNKK